MTEEQKESMMESSKRAELSLKRSISLKKHLSDPENRAKLRERIKKAYQENPEYGKKKSEHLKKYYSNPENMFKCKERLSKMRDDPEYRKKISEGVKRSWANRTPEERKKIIDNLTKASRREEVREKRSISMRKHIIEIRENIHSKNLDPSRRTTRMRARKGKFYGERDKYYNMTKKIDDSRRYRLITSAETFLRFLSPTK